MSSLADTSISTMHRLPPDLMFEVSKHVREKSDLAHLSTTCKYLFPHVQRILYNTITLDMSTGESTDSMYLLLRTLLRNPALSLLIKHFAIRGTPPVSGCPVVWDSADTVLLENVIERCHLRPGQFKVPLACESPYAAASLILSMLTELKTMKIGYGVLGADGSRLIDDTLLRGMERYGRSPIATPTTVFAYLEHIEIGYVEPELRTLEYEAARRHLPLNKMFVLGVLQRCPRLKSAKIAVAYVGAARDAGFTMPSITALTLLHTRDRRNSILTALPSLKYLDYDYQYGLYEEPGAQEILIQKLSFVKSTLEHLRINLERIGRPMFSRYEPLPARNNISGRLNGLKSFPCLLSLEILPALLLGCPDSSYKTRKMGPLLPASLRKLRLVVQCSQMAHMTWSDEHCAKLLRAFLPSWREYTPNLEALTIEVAAAAAREVEGEEVWKLLMGGSWDWNWRRIPLGFEYTIRFGGKMGELS